MKIPYQQIDAFTTEPFRGNPAGVCRLDTWLPDVLLQRIAAEMNLSETAFVVHDGCARRLRWFTPEAEVPLCGHATLATAHVLFAADDAPDMLEFDTASGRLSVTRYGDRYEMDFPALPPVPCQAPTSLAGALGIVQRVCLHNDRSIVAVLGSADEVRRLRPNFDAIRRLPKPYVIATAPGDRDGPDACDFVSRFFAPAVGVPEDPVTGSAHCVLTPYWSRRLGGGTLHARQLSQRGGELWCTHEGDRVRIAGHAVTVVQGTLTLPDDEVDA